MSTPHRLRLRSSLMIGCAACGLALAWSGAARAQAFQATPSTVFGNVTYNRATPGVETVTVNSPSAVIDWSNPSPLNPFVFLPAGNVATFQNGVNNSNFVALNRILVSVPVRFDGRVVSQLVSASGTSPGGTLLFSTPGGIIIGANAVFDVGNLVLTTLNVNVDAAGNFYDPATRGFTFAAGRFTSGAVTTEAGARINALSPNSYVAFVAPAINHGGNVQVNGAAAYIAANQVEMRANDGLFDIVVSIGTDSAVPITHTGTTGGPASTGAADIHRIFMVAVPRSQAITTLLEGNVGFDSAVNASVENGEIVLSAGYNVVGGNVDASAPVIPDIGANISIDGGTISSSLTGYAVTDAIASGFGSSGQLHAVQDLTLVAGQTAALIAGAGQVVTMDRNVTLVAPGGSAGIVANTGGSVTVAGNVLIDASRTGFSPSGSGDAGDGIGGEASIYSDGGTIAISGSATLLARGIGGHASYAPDTVGAGGNGQGGVARVLGINGGTVGITGNLSADASGVGGFTSGYNANIALVPGATGTGGDVYVLGASGGAVTVTGSSILTSNGQGGASIYTAGGAGAGDEVRIQASGGNVTLTGPVTISAVGTGGQGASGGAGTGGELDINALRGNVRMGATSADLSGRGGAALTAAAAGNGTGGEIAIFADADTGSVDIASFDGHADGIGADGSNGATGGNAGSGQGGEIDIETSTDALVSGARPGVHFGALSLAANGTGGAGGTGANGAGGVGGTGNGGEVTLAVSQAPITVDGQTTISATGIGGATAAGGGAGPAGIGGTIDLSADRSALTLTGGGAFSVRGQGGNGRDGGIGQGGSIRAASNQGQIAFTGDVAMVASATGGNATDPNGDGGSATGGSVEIDVGVGAGAATPSFFGGGAFSFDVSARGGNGGAAPVTGPGGRGGFADAGTVTIAVDAANGRLRLGNVSVRGDGTGGVGGASATGQGGTGGAGTGGQVLLYSALPSSPPATYLGTATFGALDVSSRGVGGAGGNGVTAGAGGNGAGGTIQLFAQFIPVAFGDAGLDAGALGGASGAGSGGQGGRGDGGLIEIAAGDSGGAISGGRTSARASGVGGDGAAGGVGQGGTVNLYTERGGRVALAGATVTANGTGGNSAAGAGTGATGTGGAVNLTATTGSIDLGGTTQINMIGRGGNGATGAAGQGGSLNAQAQGGTLDLGDTVAIAAAGFGGSASSGRGGDGSGGNVQIRAVGGPAASSVSGGAVTVSAVGQGGSGANPAGRGGNGIGGSIVMLADAVRGSIAFGATSADAGGTGGDGGTGASGRGGDGIGGTVTAGTEQNVTPGCTTPATCAAAASGGATFASLDLSTSASGGQGGVRGNANGGIATLQSVGAPTIVTGAATLRADADSQAANGGAAGQAVGGQVVLSASTNSATGTAGRLQAGSVNGTANASGGTAASTAGRWQVSATGGGSIATTDLSLAALGGAALPAASRVDVLAGGTISATGTASLSSAGTVSVNASGAGKLAGGTIRFAAGDDVVVATANPAANAITIDATDLAFTATDDVTIGAGVVTRSANGTNVQAGDLATIAGQVLGRTIQIASADIDLQGGLGDAGTQAVTLTVAGASPTTQPTILGGTAQGPGYTLTNAEAARIRADALRVNAPAVGTSATRNPDLIIRDLSLTGGGAATGIGTVTIVTPGIARVQGNLLLVGARATDGIAITATERLEVVTPNGSVRVRDTAGAPAGTLTLTSNNVWAVGQTILDKLHTDPAYAGRDADLADNGSSQAPRGYVEGNAVTINAGNSLFVQNTGENPTNRFSLTGPAFGGITVGPGGLIIRATGTSPASVTAFGRRINADGTITTGYDFFFAVDFRVGAASSGFAGSAGANLVGPASAAAGSPTGYTAASTFNTCIIATGQCPLRRPADTGPGGRDPIIGPPATIQLPRGLDDDNVDTSFATEPLIEEPVTSGGESTLWTPPCDPARDQRCVGEHP